MPGVLAGTLNRHITIQQGVPGSTTEGDATMTWQQLDDVWAMISPASTQDLLLAAQRGEEITHNVTIRYQKQFLPPQDLRVLYQGRIFFILGAMDPNEDHTMLVFKCQEYVTTAKGAQ